MKAGLGEGGTGETYNQGPGEYGGPRSLNNLPSGMRAGLRCGPEPAAGQLEIPRMWHRPYISVHSELET